MRERTSTRLRDLAKTTLREHPDIASTRNVGGILIDRLNLDVMDVNGTTWHVIVRWDPQP